MVGPGRSGREVSNQALAQTQQTAQLIGHGLDNLVRSGAGGHQLRDCLDVRKVLALLHGESSV